MIFCIYLRFSPFLVFSIFVLIWRYGGVCIILGEHWTCRVYNCMTLGNFWLLFLQLYFPLQFCLFSFCSSNYVYVRNFYIAQQIYEVLFIFLNLYFLSFIVISIDLSSYCWLPFAISIQVHFSPVIYFIYFRNLFHFCRISLLRFTIFSSLYAYFPLLLWA